MVASEKTRVVLVLALAACVGCDDDHPSIPTRYGTPLLRIVCDTGGRSPLVCAAQVTCSGGPCAPDVPNEVTQAALWSVDHPAVARAIAPGMFGAVAPGDTVVRAQHGFALSGARTISVFAGSPPLPTHEIFGTVSDPTGPLDGVTVEAIQGYLAGRSVTSGVPPPLPPGFTGPFGGAGYYRVLGAPPGTHQLRFSKTGYVTQDRTVTVTVGSPSLDVVMQPQ